MMNYCCWEKQYEKFRAKSKNLEKFPCNKLSQIKSRIKFYRETFLGNLWSMERVIC